MGRNSNTVVACYTLSGELVKTYPSAVIASRSRNLFKRTIDRCIRGDIKVVKNLQWKRYPVNEVHNRIDPVVIEKKILTIKPVARLNESNEIDKIYPSINKAAKDNDIDSHSLRDLLNKKYPYLGKTKFRYLTDNEIYKYNLKKGREVENKTKPVIQYDLNGNYIKTYPSIREATISLGKNVNNRGIGQCLTGKYQTAFGYIWKYKDDENVKRKRKHKEYIVAINSNNEIIHKFISVKEASKYIGVTVTAINNAIRLKQKVKSFYWFRK